MDENAEETQCSADECERSFKNHRWGRIKAQGWFQQKDGRNWCPDHLPPWVEAWRARRQQLPTQTIESENA